MKVDVVLASDACRSCFPVAMPGVRLAHSGAALHTDRGHSLGSLDSATGGGRLTLRLRCPIKSSGLRVSSIL